MDEDDLPISAVEHYAYCPRQAALIHVEGVWDDNTHTALGTADHQPVDRGTRNVRRDGIATWLSLPIGSEVLGIVGLCDAVEFRPGPVPVEHKPIRTRFHLSSVSQQLALQAMCLEEMFDCSVETGVVFANGEHRRQEVPIDDALRAAALTTLGLVRRMVDQQSLPPRASDQRCRRCSLRDMCLVDETGRPLTSEWDPTPLEEDDP